MGMCHRGGAFQPLCHLTCLFWERDLFGAQTDTQFRVLLMGPLCPRPFAIPRALWEWRALSFPKFPHKLAQRCEAPHAQAHGLTNHFPGRASRRGCPLGVGALAAVPAFSLEPASPEPQATVGRLWGVCGNEPLGFADFQRCCSDITPAPSGATLFFSSFRLYCLFIVEMAAASHGGMCGLGPLRTFGDCP